MKAATIWRDHAQASDDLMELMRKGSSLFNAAQILSTKYNTHVSIHVIQNRLTYLGGRPPLDEGIKKCTGGGHHGSTYWTRHPEAVNRALDLIKIHSYSEVADLLFQEFHEIVTRSAIVAKVKRLIKPEKRKAPNAARSKPTQLKDPIIKFKSKLPGPQLELTTKQYIAPMTMPVPIWELNNDACRWIVSTLDEPTLYCAAQTERGRSFCPYHRQIGERSLVPAQSIKSSP